MYTGKLNKPLIIPKFQEHVLENEMSVLSNYCRILKILDEKLAPV